MPMRFTPRRQEDKYQQLLRLSHKEDSDTIKTSSFFSFQMKYQRPRLTLYFAVSSIICLTIVFAFLDFKFTLIPQMAYNSGPVEEYDYVQKFEHIFNDTTRITKKILVWTPFFRTVKQWAKGINNDLKKCDYACTATHNRGNLPLSDAIIFHDADINIIDMPGIRIRRQPWILYTLEPTALIKKNYNWMNGMFNWTISYRNYSTILGAYGGYVLKNMNTPTPQPVSLNNKNKTMYASISNCHDAGRRFKLIKEIMKYIDVELFGRCGDRKCTNFRGPCHPKEILNLYKFRLAFENSHCRHYVTEKYWSTLAESDTIPIVNWIKGQINPTVIPNSYINFFEFKNISDFVKYIEKVGTNETLFKQYFEWKKMYELGKSDSDYCKLCEKLHKPYQSQVYTDIGGGSKKIHVLNTAVYGKTMENVRERVDIKLISNEEKLRKYVAKPSFKRFKIFNEHLIGVEMTRVSIELNRPAYLGAQILDISKNLMAWFHHLVMKPKYGNNLELLFTDTDSLCYEIATDDIYEDMENMREYFDTSNYDESLPIHSNNYKKIPGKFKDELGGIAMKEFIGLRPKMYSLIYNEVDHRDDNLESEVREVAKITTKGITKTARDKHEHFRRCLFENRVTTHNMKVIRSHNHQRYLDNVKKKGLCDFDDKRYWKGIHSMAFGHYKIDNNH